MQKFALRGGGRVPALLEEYISMLLIYIKLSVFAKAAFAHFGERERRVPLLSFEAARRAEFSVGG